MAEINKKRLVQNISGKTSVYMPIIEAVVNSIDAIEKNGERNGQVDIILKRANTLLSDDALGLPPVLHVEVVDNGIGFDEENRKSFDTLYSALKASVGGKGFGRFMYLKYFHRATANSVFIEDSKSKRRKFNFTVEGNDLISDEVVEDAADDKHRTSVLLENLHKRYQNDLNRKIETIARKLFEEMLGFFANEKVDFPKITIIDEHTGERILLNNYLGDHDEIQLIHNSAFELESHDQSNEFKLKVYKIYFSKARSSVYLTAHNRVVSRHFIHTIIPEFADDFYDKITGDDGDEKKRNYTIKAYVTGDYLDKHVAPQRDQFNFGASVHDEDKIYPHSESSIIDNASQIVREQFPVEIASRRNKRLERINDYVSKTAPWHSELVEELDMDKLPMGITEKEIDAELHKIAFEHEAALRQSASSIIASKNIDGLKDEVKKITAKITTPLQSQLTHYVVLRKIIIDVFEKTLELRAKDNKHELEEAIHKLIYPLKRDSENTGYHEHNLWLVDERLSFARYLSSDLPLTINDKTPDVLAYDNPVLIRDGDDLSSPISIFELKRPGRKEYGKDDDPVRQVWDYVKQIRKGDYTTPKNRPVNVNENTPAYGYIICDLTSKMREICDRYGMTISPDNMGYFHYHQNHKIYTEVISFDKLVKDSRLRNKIFFKMAGIE